ncbi:hypothetical protein [Nitrosomonas sp. Is79A3]|uniref:hypothetical protein n=1 Tax=Nitrosomonas sp. (strain Is79A3) TaxID=261292 RepID=UPI000309F31C
MRIKPEYAKAKVEEGYLMRSMEKKSMESMYAIQETVAITKKGVFLLEHGRADHDCRYDCVLISLSK